MYKNIKKNSKGFTIIEVLIVLAIAALIMLIVFLAVPALQRNSRNSERRTEASRLLTSANEWVTNSNGATLKADHMNAVFNMAGVKNLKEPSFGAGSTPNRNDTRIVMPGECYAFVAIAAQPSTPPRQIALQYGLEPDGTTACIQM